MRTGFAATLREGDEVRAVFCLRSREMRSTRAGEAYLACELTDRTGRIAAVMFKPDRIAQAIPSGSVVEVDGTVTSYRGVLRISLRRMRPTEDYDVRELLPVGTRDTKELLAHFRELIRSIETPALKAVVRRVFKEEDLLARFVLSPASQAVHHAYTGGLLEHTVSVASLCGSIAALYPEVDRDLLVTGALLHDIGKVDELTVGTAIELTEEGRLLGHVVLGERRVQRAITSLGDRVPGDLAARLSHVLISHHGELEWGSPKRPSTIEALLLHHADNLDAKAAAFSEAVRSAARVEEPWTDAFNLFRRPLYVPRPMEDDRHPVAPADEDLRLHTA